jgi:hypothetical protein
VDVTPLLGRTAAGHGLEAVPNEGYADAVVPADEVRIQGRVVRVVHPPGVKRGGPGLVYRTVCERTSPIRSTAREMFSRELA